MEKFIVTFGSGHLGTLGLYHHVIIEAPDELRARIIAKEAFDGKWSSIYPGDDDYPVKYNTKNLGRLRYESEYQDVVYWSTFRD
jgi:hypothetical protein